MSETYDRFEQAWQQWERTTQRELEKLHTTAECLPFSRLLTLARSGAPAADLEAAHLPHCGRCTALWRKLVREFESTPAPETLAQPTRTRVRITDAETGEPVAEVSVDEFVRRERTAPPQPEPSKDEPETPLQRTPAADDT